MVTPVKQITLDEFETFLDQSENADRLFELIDGEIVEKVPTEEHGMIAHIISGEIYIYLRQNPIGRAGVEVRYQVPGDSHNSRMPDFSLRLKPQSPIVTSGAVAGMPDFAVEIKSPRDSTRSLREKADYYLANGVKLIWVIYPNKKLVEVYQPDEDILFYTENDTLDGGTVLPEFALAVKTLFET